MFNPKQNTAAHADTIEKPKTERTINFIEHESRKQQHAYLKNYFLIFNEHELRKQQHASPLGATYRKLPENTSDYLIYKPK